MASADSPDRDLGVYGITVAAALVGTGVQNLRLYEARGLLRPDRTDGGTRRYSSNDLDRLRRIGALLEGGLNLVGIAMVMDLQDQNTQLRNEMEEQRWLTQTPPITNSRLPQPDNGPDATPSNRTRS